MLIKLFLFKTKTRTFVNLMTYNKIHKDKSIFVPQITSSMSYCCVSPIETWSRWYLMLSQDRLPHPHIEHEISILAAASIAKTMIISKGFVLAFFPQLMKIWFFFHSPSHLVTKTTFLQQQQQKLYYKIVLGLPIIDSVFHLTITCFFVWSSEHFFLNKCP